jgi:hypothetical protein
VLQLRNPNFPPRELPIVLLIEGEIAVPMGGFRG